MIGRRQLPVASRVTPTALSDALRAALRRDAQAPRALSAALRNAYGARRVALTNSGTSALVLALRLTVGEDGAVAFPGYACVDLAAAARYTGVRVRLYDVDPRTLSPDMDSLTATLERGVEAVVVVHLYGYPANVVGVMELAERFGIPVIEDAAQGAGGTLHGRLLGSFGALSLLSFGRGKGTSGGHGGALLSRDPRFDDLLSRAMRGLGARSRGWGDLAAAAAQWALGRPALYGIPSAIPGLRLGEMVYHAASEPAALSHTATALVRRAMAHSGNDLAARRRNAATLTVAATEGGDISKIELLPGGESGYLRFPVLDSGGRAERPALGVLRGYPRTLHEQAELRPCLVDGEPPTPGALELRRTLFTLPTHFMVRRRDVDALVDWLRIPPRVIVPARSGAGAMPRVARSH
jgi:hypothetical protein